MLKTILIAFMLVFTGHLFAQKHPDGPFKTYYDTGEIKQEGVYRNDKKVGQWKDYYNNGQLKRSYIYAPNGLFSGIEEEYSSAGALTYKTQVNSESGLDAVKYYPTGKIRAKYTKVFLPKEGRFIVQGTFKDFYEDERLKNEGNYVANNLNGVWKQFYNTGELEWEVTYANGVKEGVYKKYYKNGSLMAEGICVMGKKEGEEKRYDNSGNSLKPLKYKAGKLKKAAKGIAVIEIPRGGYEHVPIYPGCEGLNNTEATRCMHNKIQQLVSANFNMNVALNSGLTGKQKIVIKYTVNKNGEVVDVAPQASHRALLIEAVRVMSLVPKMEPGVIFDELVDVPYTLPIIFVVN